jgi:DNA-binding NtrC family response regulator
MMMHVKQSTERKRKRGSLKRQRRMGREIDDYEKEFIETKEERQSITRDELKERLTITRKSLYRDPRRETICYKRSEQRDQRRY